MHLARRHHEVRERSLEGIAEDRNVQYVPRAEEGRPDAREGLFDVQQTEHAVVGAEDGLLADDGRPQQPLVLGRRCSIPRAAVEVLRGASSISIGDDRRAAHARRPRRVDDAPPARFLQMD